MKTCKHTFVNMSSITSISFSSIAFCAAAASVFLAGAPRSGRLGTIVRPESGSVERPEDWFQHTKLALGDQGNMLIGSYVTCPEAYIENFFVYACQLEHRTDGDERFVSGIDTRGAAAQCYWNWDSGAGTHHAIVFSEVTSLLRVFSNKVLEVVQ